jgi:hypothetical protein
LLRSCCSWDRCKLIWKLADLLEAHADELA